MSNLIGQSLDHYQILEQLGEGGMATVYKAKDTRLDRYVAIKIIRPDQFAPAMLNDIRKRFEREAKALAKLAYPNIVPVHDYGEHDGAPYLVMEYVPGGTLKQKSETPMPWLQSLRILVPIAHALAYAHEHNIIHRDIKPANILLSDLGLPMLSDFGIAKILESNEGATLTGTGMTIGTPEYMAPEQWNGESGPGVDIYALGVVLYELVTGRKPYIANTPMSVMLKQVNDPLPPPSQFVPDLPKGLENALLKALEKRPEDRFPSMAAFAAELDNLASGQTFAVEVKAAGAVGFEQLLTEKTLLAAGGEVDRASGVGGSPGSRTAPGTPVSNKESRRSVITRRSRWILAGVLTVILLLGSVAGAIIAAKGLRSKSPLLALSGRVTDPIQSSAQNISSSQTSSPLQTQAALLASPGAKVKVLWDISHGPRVSADGSLYSPDGMYKSLAQALVKDHFVITSGDLSQLNSYDILVISELSGKLPFTDNETAAIDQFVRASGHGLLILGDTPSYENLADLVGRKFSIGLGESISTGPASNSNEPFFTGVNSLAFLNGGGVFLVSPPAQIAALDQDGNAVIAFCECDTGRVMAISDSNLWDNFGINQADNQRFALNTFRWLAKTTP